MSFLCHTYGKRFAPIMFALMMVCALLTTQSALSRHVVEHAYSAWLTANTANNESGRPDAPVCLTCLEHQAHGAALTGSLHITVTDEAISTLSQTLPPNLPYLTPERASQRAPPFLS